MYEAYFGFSGTPFNLNPDPAFYFESRGHGNALSYLKFGAHQGEGFVVVTGEIGAGKTTLVRTLLSELDADKIVAAQIVSTQLEAGDLLRSVAIAFGVATKSTSKAEVIATIEAFLTHLVIEGRRALLIVDEAQNLNREAIEELRMLSNFQLSNHALLQSFLVGQPELRVLLTSKPMEQLRQRVIASCHLGPMDRSETQAYVIHRLKKVGWVDRPTFDENAFEQIYRWTNGIPRRVNLLCNRLLLAAFLSSAVHVDAGLVETVARELIAEVGESAVDPIEAAAQEAASEELPLRPTGSRNGLARDRRPMLQHRSRRRQAGPTVCVATSRGDDIKMAVLIQALQARSAFPSMILVRIGDPADYLPNDSFFRQLGVEVPTIDLSVSELSAALRIAEVMQAFEPVIAMHEPGMIVVSGASDAVLACGMVACKTGHWLVQVDAGQGHEAESADGHVNRKILTRIVDDLVATDEPSIERLAAEGADVGSVVMTGSLLTDAVALALAAPRAPGSVSTSLQRWKSDKRGYCVVALADSSGSAERHYLTELMSVLRKISSETPVVWLMSDGVAAMLDALGLRKMLRDDKVAIVRALAYTEMVHLFGGANCVLTDSHDVQTQAAALGVPSMMLTLDRTARVSSATDKHALDQLCSMASTRARLEGAGTDTPARRGGRAAERIVDHLVSRIAAAGQVDTVVPMDVAL